MNGYYLTTLRISIEDTQERALLVYIATTKPNASEIIDRVRQYCRKRALPERIITIAPQTEADALNSIVHDAAFISEIPTITRYQDTPPVTALYFDVSGSIIGRSAAFCKDLRRQGLTTLFKDGKGLLSTAGNFHYTLPNDKHCEQFIRTSNVLTDGDAILFTAFCCLSYMPDCPGSA